MPQIDYTSIFSNALNEIYFFSVDTLQFIEVNHGARENLGYSMTELWELTPLEIKPEFTYDQFQKLITPLKSGEINRLRFKTVHKRKDDTLYPVDIDIQMSSMAEGFPVFVAVIQDITEQKKNDERLAYASAIIDSSNDAIIGMTLDGVIISWNRGAESIYDYSAPEAIGQSINILTRADSSDEIDNILNQIKAGIMVNHYETTRLCKDGTTIEVSLTLSLIKDKEGHIFGVSAIERDISNQKALARKLHKLEIRNQRFEIANQFIQGSSHEFRTPLSIIQTKAHLIARSEPGLKHYVEGIEKQVRNLNQLLSRFHEISRLELIRNLHFKYVDLQSTFNYVIDECKKLFGDKVFHFQIEFDENVPKIAIEENLIRKMLIEILKNACQHSQVGDEIHIHVTRMEDKVRITVRDKGDGIRDMDLNYIFTALFRGDKARPMNGNHGVGLYIANRIIILHHGELEAQSDTGEGTTVSIYLPIHQAIKTDENPA